MRKRSILLAGVLAVAVAAPVADAAKPKPKAQKVTARLAVVAPAAGGSGSLTGTAANLKGGVQFKWHLTVAHLSGSPTSAMLKLSSNGLSFALCKPCKANGYGAVSVISSLWKKIQSGDGVIVVTTAAHPSGELRGTLNVSG